MVGVQWHPEEMSKTDQMSANLFYNFVAAAAADWRVQVPAEWGAQFYSACIAPHVNGSGEGEHFDATRLDAGGSSVGHTAGNGKISSSVWAAPENTPAVRGNCG